MPCPHYQQLDVLELRVASGAGELPRPEGERVGVRGLQTLLCFARFLPRILKVQLMLPRLGHIPNVTAALFWLRRLRQRASAQSGKNFG